MSPRNVNRRRLVILLLTVLAFGIAFYSGSQYRGREDAPPAISGVSMQPPSPLPPPANGENPGSPLSTIALSGHWTLAILDPNEGQARSPALLRLLRVHNQLAADPTLQRRLHYLYLPWSGDDEVLKDISALGDNITAYTPGPEHMGEVFSRFGADPQSDEAVLYLIGPDVKLHALFTPGEDAANIAEDLAKLIIPSP